MSNYPKFHFYPSRSLADLQTTLINWGNELTRELDTEDTAVRTRPSTTIYTVASVSEIGRPRPGDVAYSTSTTKFRGYTTTAAGWVDFN